MSGPTIARHVSRAKAERLVATGRIFACSIALVSGAIGFATHRGSIRELVIVGAWWLVAAAVALYAHRHAHPQTTPLLLVFDLLVIALLLMSTGGVTSVYFPMIVMPPFAANLLYGQRVILWVAAGGVVVYVATLLGTHARNDPRVMIMRFGVVVLLGTAVLLRAAYEERVHRDIEQLATWPRTIGSERHAAIREMLQRAVTMLRASRAAVQWTDRDGEACFAQLDGDEFELDEESFEAVVAPQLGGASAFLAPGLRSIDGAIEAWSGPFLAGPFGERLRAQSVIGAKFVAQTVSGWLFVVDVRDASADDLMLAEIVARLVSSGLDQINLADVMRDGAAAAERLRLSRDLHDGLLQSLSGLALHAQAARRTVTRDPRDAEQRLGTVVEQLAESQRALRDFVDELRPELLERRQPLAERLGKLAASIERQWDVPVSLSIEGQLDAASAGDIAAIVGEALTNAAKHAGASRIEASVRADEGGIRVDVVDDGRGFPFHGRYELSQLVAQRRGPWSLRERVASLGGEMAIDSTSRGSRVEVRLPRAS